MRRAFLVVAVLLIIGLVIGFYPSWVEKPVVNGVGPMAVSVSAQYAAPEYHSPLDYYRTHHMDLLDRGDLQESDCLHCHEPARSCNNCHDFVGVKEITGQ
ncbi:MAG: hypothetical protein ACP5UQ_03045 [Anaerolineae bacterium]